MDVRMAGMVMAMTMIGLLIGLLVGYWRGWEDGLDTWKPRAKSPFHNPEDRALKLQSKVRPAPPAHPEAWSCGDPDCIYCGKHGWPGA